MEMQFTLEGLDCPVCAAKIERNIRKLEEVETATVDFNTRRLVMDIDSQDRAEAVVDKVKDLIKQTGDPVELVPKGQGTGAAQGQGKPAGDNKKWGSRIIMGLGIVLFALGLALDLPAFWRLAVFIGAYLLVGGDIVLCALRNISKGQIFDENFLMSLASIGAFVIGEYPEAVAVMLFYKAGEAFQDMAVNRSRRSISSLMDIRPDFAVVRRGEELLRLNPEEVRVGEDIVVKPGEKIPLDGIVREGRSALDTSALTGESLPRDVEPGSEVLSGSINRSGLLTVTVTKEFGESTVSKILNLVENAGSKKAAVENFITKFARWYTPAVVLAAFLLAALPPLFIPGAVFADWLRRALVFLVVSCPCALVISIPLSFFGGIGGASRQGILVKGGNFLEALNDVDTVVFDKTGTLTRGVFAVTGIAPAPGWAEADLLYYAAAAEKNSNHPIAQSIVKACGKIPDKGPVQSYEEIAGKGVRVQVGGKAVLAGNGKFLEENGVACKKTGTTGTVVYVAVEGSLAGHLVISDELKADSKQAIKALKKAGVRRVVMLTGDNRVTAEKTALELGLDEFYAELLPQGKVEKLEELEKSKRPGGKIVFVGDGINDAPVLARSDIGIAMGGVGSDAAIEAADIVLMTDEPSKIASALGVAKKTRAIVLQNIVFALGVKGVLLILGALGAATMWEAVFGDVGVALIAVFNAMRALRQEKKSA
ncbi:MAG: cadmium-translocating P-type ATPase [Treponema sp.]|jgi:Cd2+/Zn2+-exporting ATPase|nr:cadmium-translocating P-type ATPase [Treponema sp.]